MNIHQSRIAAVRAQCAKYTGRWDTILIEISNSSSLQTPVLFMSSRDAEAVKLFANSYLAMRISFFNEFFICFCARF